MLTITLLVLALSGARAYFNVTKLIIPEVVPANQREVELECQYDANFTLLNWFKGPNEFFRYKPGAAPSTHSFPILGVGTIKMISCGPMACRLLLGGLTEEATGLYRCDLERDSPPYQFATKSVYMQVYSSEHRKPSIEGLSKEYGEGDVIQAYCRAEIGAELRWYINGHEMDDMRGSATLKTQSTRFIFMGIPPWVTVQCAEFRDGKLSGSTEARARWKETKRKDEPLEQRNAASNLKCFGALSVFCVIFKQILF